MDNYIPLAVLSTTSPTVNGIRACNVFFAMKPMKAAREHSNTTIAGRMMTTVVVRPDQSEGGWDANGSTPRSGDESLLACVEMGERRE